jgi:nitrite reductase/ring-hydroxylating ferredoxin subunit
MADDRIVCESRALVEGSQGVRFTVRRAHTTAPAFAVRHGGVAYAYLNRCAHRSVELDWEPGRFFDAEKRWLICATHGALYDPASGSCIAGPCRGGALRPVPVTEVDGNVCLAPDGGWDMG